ncbi:hypothetical protein DPMN_180738 [Dreissena polymorpha]|uniref:Uncharacterized protein n=1 Tax=Dreissena polymorpha TaxID=45954 RepID=A0A9D4DCI9_DREPO|nr:hypothetical protein DPMN_180738 [Dreissena polymorpha]
MISYCSSVKANFVTNSSCVKLSPLDFIVSESSINVGGSDIVGTENLFVWYIWAKHESPMSFLTRFLTRFSEGKNWLLDWRMRAGWLAGWLAGGLAE